MQLTKTTDDRTTDELDKCLTLCLFFAVYALANDKWTINAVACVHACKSGPFDYTLKPWRQVVTVRSYRAQQLHDTDNMMYTTHCKHHDLTLSLKFTTETFVDFPKFNWSYDLLCYMLQNTSYGLPIKNTHLQISNQFSLALYHGHTIKVHQSRPSERPSNNYSDIIRNLFLMHNNTQQY